MEIKRIHIVGMVLGIIVLGISFIFKDSSMFAFFIGVGFIIIAFPFVLTIVLEAKRESEKEEMFLEFTRNLVESVKAGVPISKSIMNVKDKPYGALSVHVKKLANQISIGIPLRKALNTFAKDIGNPVISRTITLIGQAEKSGGDIGEILEDVAGAVSMSDKLKKERKAAISTLVSQGYIIFFVFILIVLVMQFKIVPMVSGISGFSITGKAPAGISSSGISPESVSASFMYLLLIQGLFSGLAIGKLAEGSIKAGIKHSFILVVSAFIISMGANAFFGG